MLDRTFEQRWREFRDEEFHNAVREPISVMHRAYCLGACYALEIMELYRSGEISLKEWSKHLKNIQNECDTFLGL
jgi:hypothetical protein